MSEEIKGYWWCKNCRDELVWQKVTFTEQCDTCGHLAEWITPEDKTEIERLQSQVDVLTEAAKNNLETMAMFNDMRIDSRNFLEIHRMDIVKLVSSMTRTEEALSQLNPKGEGE